MLSANRVLGLISLAAGGAVWVLCGYIDMPAETHTLSPRFFPRLLAAVLSLLGLVLALRGGGRSLGEIGLRAGNAKNLSLVGLTLGYALLFGHMDYRLLTPVFIGCAMWVLGSRKAMELVLVPLIATAVLFGIFRYGFLVLLPEMG